MISKHPHDDDDQLSGGENELSSGGRLSVFPNGSLVSDFLITRMMIIKIMLLMTMMLM